MVNKHTLHLPSWDLRKKIGKRNKETIVSQDHASGAMFYIQDGNVKLTVA